MVALITHKFDFRVFLGHQLQMRQAAKHSLPPLLGGISTEIIQETEKTGSQFKISSILHGIIKRGSFQLTKG